MFINPYDKARSGEVNLEVTTDWALRTMPESYTPGQPLAVSIAVQPKTATQVYAVEENVLQGWKVSGLKDGQYDARNQKIKFGPFLDNKPRTLTYTLTPPLSAVWLADIYGVVAVDDDWQSITGDRLMECSRATVFHPADVTEENRISIEELTEFALQWRRGTFSLADWAQTVSWDLPDTVLARPKATVASFVTRAAMIWKKGEAYYYLPDLAVPLCWTNDVQVSGVTAAAALKLKRPRQGDSGPSALRELPETYHSGQPITVNLRINPGTEITAYAVEEQPPAGWTVSQVFDDGDIDVTNQVVRWGPFFDNEPRVLTYQATSPDAASGLAAFSGVASLDGEDFAIGGDQAINGGDVIQPSAVRFEAVQVSHDQIRLTLTGSGVGIQLQRSSDLRQWESMTNAPDSTGSIQFAAPTGAECSHQFYRVIVH